jgi:hypothetical protein
MTTQTEALKLALEAMQYADACLKKQLTTKTKHEYAQDLLLEAGKALEEALANHMEDNLNMVKQERPQNCGTSYCSCIECVMDEQEQGEPDFIECGNCHEGLADMEHVCKKCLGAGWVNNPKQEQGEPVAWRNAAIRIGEDLCSVGPHGYYDMTAEQWLDWALSVVTVHLPPQQRKPLTDDQIYEMYNEPRSDAEMLEFARAIEAAHGIKGEA